MRLDSTAYVAGIVRRVAARQLSRSWQTMSMRVGITLATNTRVSRLLHDGGRVWHNALPPR